MQTDLDMMELDDLGIPETEHVNGCPHCGVSPEISPLDGSFQLFHYENCYFMNPENFLDAA